MRTTHLDDREYPSLIQVAQMSLQWLEHKMLSKKGENGVSTPFVLSMKQYAHIKSNHAKKGPLVQTMLFYPLNV